MPEKRQIGAQDPKQIDRLAGTRKFLTILFIAGLAALAVYLIVSSLFSVTRPQEQPLSRPKPAVSTPAVPQPRITQPAPAQKYDPNSPEGRAVTGLTLEEYQRNQQSTEAYDPESPEGRAITSLYRGILGRDPDPEGFYYWIDRLRDGSSLEQLRREFYNSEEYRSKHPPVADEKPDFYEPPWNPSEIPHYPEKPVFPDVPVLTISQVKDAKPASCGDGKCGGGESLRLCPEDCGRKIFPSDSDATKSCHDSSGKPYTRSGEGAARWFHWGGCGAEKYYQVTPGREIVFYVYTDTCSACVCNYPDFMVSEYVNNSWSGVIRFDLPEVQGLAKIVPYTPQSKKIKVSAPGCFYLDVYE